MGSDFQNLGRTGISRRNLLRVAGAGGAGALILGGQPRGRVGAAAQETASLSFWLPGGSTIFCETHKQIAADYGAAHPGVVVEVSCGTNQEDFTNRFLGSIAGGNPPEASVIWDTPVSFGVQGALRPLDELLPTGQYTPVENWPAAVLKSCQFDGQTYGLPYTAGTYGIWYNQELFEAKGIPSDRASFPKTWEEVRRLSKEFTQWDGDRLVSAGFIPRQPDFPYTIPIWSALNGSQIYDSANQRFTIDSEQNVEMMDFFVAWLDEEYRGDYSLVERSGGWQPYPTDEGQPPEFQAGHLAMVEWGTWGLGDLYQYGDVAIQKWDVALHPVGPSGETAVSGYWPNWLAIPEGTQHPEEAFAYLDHLSGVGVLVLFAVLPDLPTNAQVPIVTPTGIIEKRGPEFAEDVMAFFRGQLEISTPMWEAPVQAFSMDQLRVAMEKIINKQSAPKDALAEAQQACQAELEKVLSGA